MKRTTSNPLMKRPHIARSNRYQQRRSIMKRFRSMRPSNLMWNRLQLICWCMNSHVVSDIRMNLGLIALSSKKNSRVWCENIWSVSPALADLASDTKRVARQRKPLRDRNSDVHVCDCCGSTTSVSQLLSSLVGFCFSVHRKLPFKEVIARNR